MFGLITDIDGVVVDTEDVHRLAYNALFEELGLRQRWTKEDYIARLAVFGGRKFDEPLTWLAEPRENWEARRPLLYARKTELFQTLLRQQLEAGQLQARHGVIGLCDAVLARADWKLCAASTCAKPAALATLRGALGPERLAGFAAVCAGADVEKKKPAPDVYLLAAKKGGLAPASCVAIEDTEHGVAAAKAAGLKCVAAPSEYATGGDFSAADLLVEDLSSIGFGDLQALVG